MISPAPRKPTPAATPVMGTVEPHRQAAQHRQSHAQQSLQIGHGGEPAQGGSGQEHRQDHHSNQSHD